MNVQTFKEPLTVKKVVRKEKAQKAFISHFLAKKEAEKMERKKSCGYCSQNEMQQQQNFLLLLKCQDNVELGYS